MYNIKIHNTHEMFMNIKSPQIMILEYDKIIR